MQLLRKIIYGVALSPMLVTLSCETELKLPGDGDPKVVLIGEVVADDSVHIRGGKSIPVKDGARAGYELVPDMVVTLTDSGGANPAPMHGVEDMQTANHFTLSYSAPTVIRPGVAYRLTASEPSMAQATVDLHIPDAFQGSIADTAYVTYREQECLRVNYRIDDQAGRHQYYLVEAFITMDSISYLRLSSYTTDTVSEQVRSGNANRTVKRILLDDASFDGTRHEGTLYLPRLVNNLYPGMPVTIFIKSIPKEYFDFLRVYDTYDPYSDGVLGQVPVRMAGNVKNGVGMVGSAYRIRYDYILE